MGNFSVDTKISYLIMGYSNIKNKQVVKGLAYLAIQLSYIWFMITTGINAIGGMITLGTIEQGWVFDERLGIEVRQAGDNSMILLIYGVAVLAVTAVVLAFYALSIKSAKKIEEARRKGEHINTLMEDLKQLLDLNFHITMMTIPLIGILIFTVLPLVYMILIAFTNFDRAHQPPGNLFDWVGLVNFGDMLYNNEKLAGTFFPVLSWTLTWAVIATVTNFFGGLVLAMMINKKGIRFKAMWRTFFVITIAVPSFISLLVMRNMLNQFGPINEILLSLGWITERIPFLENTLYARISIIVVNLWVGIPYTMLITSGILMNIPEDIYESARIDGANIFVMFVKITMPHILFVTTPYLITQFIGNINNFNVIFFLTGGTPTNSNYYFAGTTDLLITWLYKLTMDHSDYNLASTIGILVFMISATFSILAFRRTSSFKNEEDFS